HPAALGRRRSGPVLDSTPQLLCRMLMKTGLLTGEEYAAEITAIRPPHAQRHFVKWKEVKMSTKNSCQGRLLLIPRILVAVTGLTVLKFQLKLPTELSERSRPLFPCFGGHG